MVVYVFRWLLCSYLGVHAVTKELLCCCLGVQVVAM